MQWLEFVADVLEIVGGILIAAAVLAVHDTEIKEHAFDEEVSRSVRKEHIFVYLGVSILIIGFILKQFSKAIA